MLFFQFLAEIFSNLVKTKWTLLDFTGNYGIFGRGGSIYGMYIIIYSPLIRLLELFELERQEDATFGEPICDRFNHS